MNNSNTDNIHAHKFKVLKVNVNSLSNHNKRIKIFNSLKTKTIDITLLQETHSTKTIERNCNRNGMVCPSGTRDLTTTPLALPLFLVKISKVKYKI